MGLSARYIPGRRNVIADQLIRQGQVVGSEWSLHPEVAAKAFDVWGTPWIDLFATRANRKLPVFCSPVPDPEAELEDAFQHAWDHLDVYAFPPFPLIPRVLARVRESRNLRMTLIAPRWPAQAWYPHLLELLVDEPRELPSWDTLLRQIHLGQFFHRGVKFLKLHAWRLSSESCEREAFLAGLRARCPTRSALRLPGSTRPSGRSSAIGVVDGVSLQSLPLFNR